MSKLTEKFLIMRRTREENKSVDDFLALESPLTIYFNDREIVTLLCTPDNLDELAVGFLVAEGMIKAKEDINSIHLDDEKGAIWIEGKEHPLAEKMMSKRYITTGCGKGTTFYNALDAQLDPVESSFKVELDKVLDMIKEIQTMSELFKETGGVHGNALCNENEIIMFRDDVGRHNAADKIIGRCFLDNIPLTNKMLLTTGRISSEILLKVAKTGISVVVSRSAPTALAIKLAEKLGVTVIGFARASRCNIYTFPDRII